MHKQTEKDLNIVLCPKCPYCGSTRLEEEDQKVVKCLDCGMGKYKEGMYKNSKYTVRA